MLALPIEKNSFWEDGPNKSLYSGARTELALSLTEGGSSNDALLRHQHVNSAEILFQNLSGAAKPTAELKSWKTFKNA